MENFSGLARKKQSGVGLSLAGFNANLRRDENMRFEPVLVGQSLGMNMGRRQAVFG